MANIKTKEEIEILREGGKKLAVILERLVGEIKPGVTTKALDDLARELASQDGDAPSFLHYASEGSARPYPASICISVNDEIVHGIPNEKEKILKEGDIVGLDMGLKHGGLFTDAAITVGVGEVDNKYKRLMKATKDALDAGIDAIKNGVSVSDVGKAIAAVAKRERFFIADDLGGHGVGHAVHEDPFIPNFNMKGCKERLRSGMVVAIEPMLNEGTSKIKIDSDGWTIKTADGKRSAHFEHTVLVTESGAEILTIA